MKTRKIKRDPASTLPRQPMFRTGYGYSRTVEPQPFFAAASVPAIQTSRLESPIVQQQETTEAEKSETQKPEEKDPVVEGLKTTGEQLLENPKFKTWFEPKLDFLKLRLWEERPSDEKAAMLTFGGVNLALAGLVFALNPKVQELLSDVNIGKPLGGIPYSPVEGFKYKLPEPGQSQYGFSGEFTFNPYLELLRERYPQVPLTGATFGLDTAYTPGQGLSLTGGKFGLEFFGGGLKAEGKSFTETSSYPTIIPGAGPLETPSTLMQSVPGLPPIQTEPGFQMMISADLYKLFPSFANLF